MYKAQSTVPLKKLVLFPLHLRVYVRKDYFKDKEMIKGNMSGLLSHW